MSTVFQQAPCAISPEDKRAQAKKVGNELVRTYGKKKFYSIDQVREANRRAGIKIDVVCWSHALFNTHADFDRLHSQAGEACDYTAMKAEMLNAVAADRTSSWFDWDLSWLEFPDLDLSAFDFFD
jgi:hypothetical protein